MRMIQAAAAIGVAAVLTASADARAAGAAGAKVTVRSYFDPGLNYFRAAEDTLRNTAGIELRLDITDGDWVEGKPLHERPEELKALREGAVVTTATRRLTAAEKAAGLDERVLGHFGAIMVVHPEAPLAALDAAKWKRVMARKDLKGLRWSDLGKVTGGKDGPVAFSLPDASARSWARPLVMLGAMPPAALAVMPPKSGLDPAQAANDVALDKGRIAVHGYDFVTRSLGHHLRPVRILAVDGVAATDATLASGQYPYSRPVVMVFGKDAAVKKGSGVAALLRWLESPRAVEVARIRALVPPAPAPQRTSKAESVGAGQETL